MLASVPAGIADGTITRRNELGMLKLEAAYFEPDSPGIGLSLDKQAHDEVRPWLDAVYGPGGNWDKPALVASAREYIRRRVDLDMARDGDASHWVQQQIHRAALGLDLTLAQARAFDKFRMRVAAMSAAGDGVLGAIAARGLQSSVAEVKAEKQKWLQTYKDSLAKGAGGLSAVPGFAEAVAKHPPLAGKMAAAFLDAHVFAGGASMPSVIASAVAVRFKGHDTTSAQARGGFRVDFGDGLAEGAMPELHLAPGADGSDSRDAKKLVWESLRTYPSVLGVPFYTHAKSESKNSKSGGERVVPIVGWALHDPRKVGRDADVFMFGRPTRAERAQVGGGSGSGSGPIAAADALGWYEEISMGWADHAAPAYGTPGFDETKVGPEHPASWDSRYCPAKRLSFAMAQAFVEALEAEGGVKGWQVKGGREKLAKRGAQWPSADWGDFVLERVPQQQ